MTLCFCAALRYSSAQLNEKAQMAKDVQNAAMHTLFYLLRVNHPRQIIAVEHDIIPVLIKVPACSMCIMSRSMDCLVTMAA